MYHIPVLAEEVIQGLKIKKGGLYFDGTLGGGGHSELILEQGGQIIGCDRDQDAINECQKRFKKYQGKFKLYKENFKNAKLILDGKSIDGALLDLGISSHQIDTPERGMSYRFDAPLDMRMDRSQVLTAESIVNEYSEKELARILFEYGEEKFARRIAANIVKERNINPITTTGKLVDIINRSVPHGQKSHPAMRTFQALRIETNNELRGLDNAIIDIFNFIKKGGRFCIISFHSLEDRIVKQTFAKLSADCICDKSLPVCVCNHTAEAKIIGKYKPSPSEIKKNSRSSSAILRIIEKL